MLLVLLIGLFFVGVGSAVQINLGIGVIGKMDNITIKDTNITNYGSMDCYLLLSSVDWYGQTTSVLKINSLEEEENEMFKKQKVKKYEFLI